MFRFHGFQFLVICIFRCIINSELFLVNHPVFSFFQSGTVSHLQYRDCCRPTDLLSVTDSPESFHWSRSQPISSVIFLKMKELIRSTGCWTLQLGWYCIRSGNRIAIFTLMQWKKAQPSDKIYQQVNSCQCSLKFWKSRNSRLLGHVNFHGPIHRFVQKCNKNGFIYVFWH